MVAEKGLFVIRFGIVRVMKIILLSSSKMLEEALLHVRRPLSDISLLHITTASILVEDPHYVKKVEREIREIGVQYTSLDLRGVNQSALEGIVTGVDVIYVGSGNTFCLLKAIRESGFDDVMPKLLDKDIVYIGSSAGAMVACPSIETGLWTERNRDRCGVTDYTGMNLVPFMFRPHFSEEKRGFYKEKSKDTQGEIKFLTDRQGLLVEDEEVTLIGEGEEVKL